MRLLDLFCGAGGGAMGYYRAGFTEIVGVDNQPQPRYPFTFVQADALEYLAAHGHEFDAIHASPPCQAFTKYKNVHKDLPGRYPNLIEPTRKVLISTGKPYIIENVEGSPLKDYIILCGSSFSLPIRRHRLFETSFFVWGGMQCAHYWQKPQYPSSTDRKPMSRKTMEIGSWDIPLKEQCKGMGIDWMTLEELAEAIPPAYTEWIGRRIFTQPALFAEAA